MTNQRLPYLASITVLLFACGGGPLYLNEPGDGGAPDGNLALSLSTVGQACSVGIEGTTGQTTLGSPVEACGSKLCLQEGRGEPGNRTVRTVCTAECSVDADCGYGTTDHCAAGFACAVATSVGDYCCKKVCVCRDDLVVGFNAEGSGAAQTVVTPSACDPAQGTVTCQNVK